MDDDMRAFLDELHALCVRHGVKVGGCGCCGSPFADGFKSGLLLVEIHAGGEQGKADISEPYGSVPRVVRSIETAPAPVEAPK